GARCERAMFASDRPHEVVAAKRQYRTPGSVRGAPGNGRPYRDAGDKNMKTKIIVILMIVLSFTALAVFSAIQTFKLKTAEHNLQVLEHAYSQKVLIVFANRNIEKGSTISPTDLTVETVYKQAVGENGYSPDQLELIIGKDVMQAIEKGQPIWKSHIN
uniref:SAF domain-containing protein n=1 Tax=Pontiella sp. TaxID=2837462 RepID=UPI00356749B0